MRWAVIVVTLVGQWRVARIAAERNWKGNSLGHRSVHQTTILPLLWSPKLGQRAKTEFGYIDRPLYKNTYQYVHLTRYCVSFVDDLCTQQCCITHKASIEVKPTNSLV